MDKNGLYFYFFFSSDEKKIQILDKKYKRKRKRKMEKTKKIDTSNMRCYGVEIRSSEGRFIIPHRDGIINMLNNKTFGGTIENKEMTGNETEDDTIAHFRLNKYDRRLIEFHAKCNMAGELLSDLVHDLLLYHAKNYNAKKKDVNVSIYEYVKRTAEDEMTSCETDK